MRSMTGHGLGRATNGRTTAEVELRSVNHKQLELKVHADPGSAAYSEDVTERVRSVLLRGHVTARIRTGGGSADAALLDRARAEIAYRELAALRAEIAPTEQGPLFPMLASVPGLFAESRAQDADDAIRALVLEATDAAIVTFDASRVAEGGALGRDMRACLTSFDGHRTVVRGRAATASTDSQSRLRERVARLLEGTQATLDPGRLEQEIALLADRADIHEELVRLDAHAASLAASLADGETSHGRRIEFVLQEMLREVNTIGSKSSDIAITRAVIDMKTELARLKEQVQNVL